jgi:hypothetical protein
MAAFTFSLSFVLPFTSGLLIRKLFLAHGQPAPPLFLNLPLQFTVRVLLTFSVACPIPLPVAVGPAMVTPSTGHLVAIRFVAPPLALTVARAAALSRASVADVGVEGEILSILAVLGIIRRGSAPLGDLPFHGEFQLDGAFHRDFILVRLEQMAARALTRQQFLSLPLGQVLLARGHCRCRGRRCVHRIAHPVGP